MGRKTILFFTLFLIGAATAFGQTYSSGFSIHFTGYGYRSTVTAAPAVQPAAEIHIWQSIYRNNLFMVGRVTSIKSGGPINEYFALQPSAALLGLAWQPSQLFEMRGMIGLPAEGSAIGDIAIQAGPQSRWIEAGISCKVWNDTATNSSVRADLRFQPMKDWKVGMATYSYFLGHSYWQHWVGGTTSLRLDVSKQIALLFRGELLFDTRSNHTIPSGGVSYIYAFQ